MQHWALVKHDSPICVQNDTAFEQTPFSHRFEQHWLASVQPLPCVRQPPPGFTAAHLLLVHTPLQHSLPVLHAPATGLSGTHAVAEQIWFEPQNPVQQSPLTAHVSPTALHAPPLGVLHVFGPARMSLAAVRGKTSAVTGAKDESHVVCH